MLEMRIHGRGGHGSVMAGKMLGLAASFEGKIAQTIPAYSAMRRGGDVCIHIRVSEEPIQITSRVYNPDGVLVLDPAWEERKGILGVGLKEGGFAVLNTRKKPEEIDLGVKLFKVGVVDATGVALKTIARTIPNTAMLGALCKATGIVTLESMEAGVKNELPARLHESNLKAIRTAYNETVVKEW